MQGERVLDPYFGCFLVFFRIFSALGEVNCFMESGSCGFERGQTFLYFCRNKLPVALVVTMTFYPIIPAC